MIAHAHWPVRSFAGIAVIAAGMVSAAAHAQTYLDDERTFIEPVSEQLRYTVPLEADASRVGVAWISQFEAGVASLRIESPSIGDDGSPALFSIEAGRKAEGEILDVPGGGELIIEAVLEGVQGRFKLVAAEIPPPAAFQQIAIGGGLMMAVGLLFILGWLFAGQPLKRWFALGAGAWFLAIVLKQIMGLAFNGPVLNTLHDVLPETLYHLSGSVYIGLLTGITEIGIAALAIGYFRKVCARPQDAVAFGVGAGAVEAILLGAGGAGNSYALMQGTPGTEVVTIMLAYTMAPTPMIALVAPIERVIAILCHVGSRMLVAYGIATNRRAYFWYGFMLLSAIDMIAGYVHVADRMGKLNMWWVELALAPFALASIYIVVRLYRQWPGTGGDAPLQKLESFPLPDSQK